MALVMVPPVAPSVSRSIANSRRARANPGDAWAMRKWRLAPRGLRKGMRPGSALVSPPTRTGLLFDHLHRQRFGEAHHHEVADLDLVQAFYGFVHGQLDGLAFRIDQDDRAGVVVDRLNPCLGLL